MSDETWGVVVDEAKINATGSGSGWWAEQAVRMSSSSVLITLDLIPIVGGTQFMCCDSREDAEFAAGYIGEHTHLTVAKATTLAAARKSVRALHAKRDGHAGCTYCRPEES